MEFWPVDQLTFYVDTRTLTGIQEKTEELLAELGVQARVVVETDQSGVIKVDVSAKEQGESLGALIGFRGETLRALQLVLSLMVNRGREGEERLRLLLDIDGYRSQHEQTLRRYAREVVEKVRSLQEAIELSPMSSYERRIIHLEVAEMEDVVTESVGEGHERRVIIQPA